MSGINVRLDMLDRLVELDSHTIVMRDDGTLHGHEGQLTGQDGLQHTLTQQKTEDLPESARINNMKVLGAIYDHIKDGVSQSALDRLSQTKIRGLTLDDHLTQGTPVSSSLVKELRQITRDVVWENNMSQELDRARTMLKEKDISWETMVDPEQNYTGPRPSHFGNIEIPKNSWGGDEKLGAGAGGEVFRAKVNGEDCIVKRIPSQLLSLERTGEPNEAMGSYLEPKDDPDYLSNRVSIAQPTGYLVSVFKNGDREDKMIAPREMRELVKQPGNHVVCHGLVMPQAGGEEVGKLMTEGRFTDEPQKKKFIEGTLQSIKGLNERGFVHRDLKPANIFFDGTTGKTTLIDTGSLFKTSKNPDQNKHPQYVRDFTAGTPLYMHPRAYRGEEHGTESDLYALGVMALNVDHPKAIEHLAKQIIRQNQTDGVTRDWLVEQLDDQIKKAQPGELLDDLKALRDDLGNRGKLSGFGIECLELSGAPAQLWNDRDRAQETYSQLLKHPALQ